MKKSLLLLFALTIVSKAIGSVELIMPDLSGPTGSQVTVPVKVTGFQNIIGAQWDVQFDPSIVTYSSVQNFGLPGMTAPGNFGITNIASGSFTFSWGDPTLMGVSLADSAVVFSVTFNIVGANAAVSNLSFANTIEIIDNSFATVPFTTNNGSITVQNAPPTGITLFMDNASGVVGSQMSVSMKAVDFTDIASMQGSIQFDPMAVSFSSVSYFGLPGMNLSNFNISQVASGKITFTWFDGTVMGIDMADSVALFTLNFTHNCAPGTSLIEIVNTPTPIEVADASFNTLNTTVASGAITGLPLVVSALAASPTICEGTSTTLTASGAATYTWLPTDSLSSATGSPVTADPSVTTTYTVSGTSLGCTVATTVTVTVDPLPDASFTATDNGDGSVTFTSTSQNTTSLSWDFGDSNTSTASPVTHMYVANSTYTVVLTATNACGNDNSTTNVIVSVIGLKDVASNTSFEVYPNPGSGVFSIKYGSNAGATFTIQVLNTVGEVVFTKEYAKTAADDLIPFDLSNFANGMYHIQVKDQHQLLNSRIIINK
jgi:PKD repeat protein